MLEGSDLVLNSPGGSQCLVCSGQAQPRYVKRQVRYWECPGCGLLYQHPLPAASEMHGFADAEYSRGVYREYILARELKHATFRERLELIRRCVPTGTLLDVGAGCGYLIDVALEAGYDAYGIEFSSVAIRHASSTARSRIVQGNIDRVLPDHPGKYDVITAFDIVEHSLDPLTFLADLRGLLRPGGLLVLTTPDTRHVFRFLMGARWPMLQPLQHTFLFSPMSMRMALERTGLDVSPIRPATKYLTLDYLVGQIEGHNPNVHRVYRVLSFLLPPSLRRRPFRVNIGEMLVLAVRPS